MIRLTGQKSSKKEISPGFSSIEQYFTNPRYRVIAEMGWIVHLRVLLTGDRDDADRGCISYVVASLY
jgi:hypothetical protein